MKPEIVAIFAIYICFALLEGWRTGFFRKANATRDDAIVEGFSTIATLGVVQPLIVFLSASVMSAVLPQYADALAGLHFVAGFIILVLADDFVNYWYHRSAHHFPLLYNLHRAHHNGEYMSIRVVFRNNVFYYLFGPHLWMSGFAVYLGLGWIYAFYLVLKLVVTISCHSDVCWDKPLYASKTFAPMMWVIERVIVTPSAHHAHHGKHKSDGVTHYKGNYGNLLLLWDVIFGTAHITRKYPDAYGIENMPEASAAVQLFWPIFRSSDSQIKKSSKLTAKPAVEQ